MLQTSQKETVISPHAMKWLTIGMLICTLLYAAVIYIAHVALPDWPPLAVMGVVYWTLAILTRRRNRPERLSGRGAGAAVPALVRDAQHDEVAHPVVGPRAPLGHGSRQGTG